MSGAAHASVGKRGHRRRHPRQVTNLPLAGIEDFLRRRVSHSALGYMRSQGAAGMSAPVSLSGDLLIEREIQLQHVHPRLAENAEGPPFGLP